VKILLVGAPNCGKSTVFNHLTGGKQRTGNWSGVTVDWTAGDWKTPMGQVELIDLPGLHSILPNPASTEDEKISREVILSGDYDLIMNVVNGDNLERDLFLTAQLQHLNVPMCLLVNMVDLAEKHRHPVDIQALASKIRMPVVGLSATDSKTGFDAFREALPNLLKAKASNSPKLPCGAELQSIILEIKKDTLLQSWQILHQLYNPSLADPKRNQIFKHYRKALLEEQGEDPAVLVAGVYFEYAHEVAHIAIQKPDEFRLETTDKIDRIVLHPWLGLPIFALAMFLVFFISFDGGTAFLDVFDQTAQAIFVTGTHDLLTTIHAPEWLIILLAQGVGGGIQLVADFIPFIAGLFLAMAVLEDSGYMARAAYITNRLMEKLGLSGKAFVPLIVGFGCNVPAVMATRTLERKRDRLMTILMIPFMSCSARLAVYAVFAAAFFADNGALMIFSLYLLGIFVAITTALLFKNTLLPSKPAPFIIELPVYHRPKLKNLFLNAWYRTKDFLLGAGKIIIIVTTVLQFVNSWGTDGTFGHDNQQDSMLSSIAKEITPIFAPMGIEEANWPATVGAITGALAKEVVVGALDALYMPTEEKPQTQGIGQTIWQGALTTWHNLLALPEALLDPLGLSIVSTDSDVVATAEKQGVHQNTYFKMQAAFGSQLSAYAYLVFILLYFPCVATVAAIGKEAGRSWMWISMVWSLYMGYTLAVLIYQGGSFMNHPGSSFLWILGILTSYLLIYLGLKKLGKNDEWLLKVPMVTQHNPQGKALNLRDKA